MMNDVPVPTEPKLTPIEIVNFHHDHFMQTRALQWKINISLWSLLAAGVFLGVKNNPQFESWLIAAAGSAIVLFHMVSVWLMQESLNYDKIRWKKHLPTEKDHLPTEKDHEARGLNLNSLAWIILQTLVTSGLALVMYAALTGKWRA